MERGKGLQRKTPLKQGKPLESRTQLQRKTPLKQGAPLKQGKPLQTRKPLTAKTPPKRTTRPLTRTRPEQGTANTRTSLKNRRPAVSPAERHCRAVVEKRSGGTCESGACTSSGSAIATDKAHRQSRGVGGTWDPSNILDLCHTCHASNHAHQQRAYDHGWHLRSGYDSRKSPVLIRHGDTTGWALLDDDGTVTWTTEREPRR